jgi:RNase P protein component
MGRCLLVAIIDKIGKRPGHKIRRKENEKAIRRNRYRRRFSPYDYPG